MNQSPAGQNSTGESDLKNYDTMLATLRDDFESQQFTFDTVLARHAGLPEAPPATWRSYLEQSELEKAEASKMKAEAWGLLIDKFVADEGTAAKALSGDSVFGELPDPPTPPMLEMPEEEGLPGDPTGSSGRPALAAM